MSDISANSRFYCQWPEGFADEAPRYVDSTFFRGENGYFKDEVAVVASLEVGETLVCTCGPHKKHTITRLTDENQDMFVLLESVGNPDYDQDPSAPMDGVSTKRVRVQTLTEAATACREYIGNNGLGGGNWAGGLVTDENDIAIAEISYNGRIWPGGYTAGNEGLFKRRFLEVTSRIP